MQVDSYKFFHWRVVIYKSWWSDTDSFMLLRIANANAVKNYRTGLITLSTFKFIRV
jgi:hypothetical protein